MKFREYEYSDEDFLGKGGSASVYKAIKGAEVYALKIFDKTALKEFGDGEKTRIERQIELQHHKIENLIKIVDGGYDDENQTYFLVMEYLPWPSLEKSIENLPDCAIPSLVAQLAKAAKELEELGIAHRDIKPANIHVSMDFKSLKLLDLGVMHPIELNEKGISGDRFVGTLRYAPPEFLLREENRDLDGHRAITFYQIGGVLYDMLMKKPLFSEYHPKAKVYRAVECITPSIKVDSKMNYWAALADNCLAKDPSHRLKNVTWNDFFEQSNKDVESRVRALGRRLTYVSEMKANHENFDVKEININHQYFFDASKKVCEAVTNIIRNDALFPFAKIDPIKEDRVSHSVTLHCELKRKMEDVIPIELLILSISRDLLDSSAITLKVVLGDIVQSERGQLSERWLMNKAESLVCDIFDQWIEACSHESSTVTSL